MEKAKRKWGIFRKVRCGRRLARERTESLIVRAGRKARTLIHEMGPRQVAAVPVLTPAQQGKHPSTWFGRAGARLQNIFRPSTPQG